MNIWISAFLVLLELIGIPVFLGTVWNIRRDDISISKIYVTGYMMMFGLFFLIACPVAYTRGSLTALVRIWGALSAVVVVIGLAVFLVDRKRMIGKLRSLGETCRSWNWECMGLAVLAFAMILAAAVLVVPSPEDDVPETVGTAIVTDSMYVYDPYTQLPGENQAEKVFSPIEMLYAVTARISGMDSTVMIHLLLPFPLILLYYAIGWELAGFFGERREQRLLFLAFWIINGTISFGGSRYLSVGIYQNPWNGSTLMTGCILPLVMLQCFSLNRRILERKKVGMADIAIRLLTVAAAQLVLPKGALLAVLLIIACTVILGIQWITGKMEKKNG